MVIGISPWKWAGFLERVRRTIFAPAETATAFTWMSSSGKSVRVEESLLLGARRPPEREITVREAPEAADDIGMQLGIFEVLGIGRIAEQFDSAKLVGDLLRMHERQIEKLAQRRVDPCVDAAIDGALCHLACVCVGGIRPRVAAKQVEGKLVAHDC